MFSSLKISLNHLTETGKILTKSRRVQADRNCYVQTRCSVNFYMLNDYLHLIQKGKVEEWGYGNVKFKEMVEE